MLLPTTDIINKQFETLGTCIGDNLMIFELYANAQVLDPEEFITLIEQYAHDIDDKLNFYKTKLIADIVELNSR